MFEEIENLKEKIPSCLRKDRRRFLRKAEELRHRLRKGREIESSLLRLMEQVDASSADHSYRMTNVPELRYPKSLPILGKKEEIVSLIERNQVVVIAGETGSGKTTQIPKMCLESGRGREGKIGCTQPRRIAATSIARYVDKEVSGNSVAFKIRFQSTDTPRTFIKFMTDGVLLAEIQSDPLLYEYDTLIIDEAHERSLNIDFILGYLKNILPKRPDLKIIVSSATIDTESFSRFFNNAPVVEVSGRTYPVEVFYNPIDHEMEESGEVTTIDMALDTTRMIFEDSPEGDVLIFMPGEADIRETVDRLRGAKWCNALVLPVFSRLTAAEQNRIFEPVPQRKVVVATNIAETSITIPGIHYVVDSGYGRISRYCPKSKTKRLPIEAISQSSAEQRKGRCGRVEDGICVRLYSEEDFNARDRYTAPEIKRSDLAEVILRMLSIKIGEIQTFPFIDPPSRNNIRDGLNTLHELGAIDEKNELTPLGREMARLPIDPRTSRILLSAIEEGALEEVLVIASALSIQDPRERPFEKMSEADERHKKFMDGKSDFLTYLNLWKEYHTQWGELKTQNKIRKFCRQHYLSYTRMREWCDLHEELTDVLEEQNKLKSEKAPASYDAVHKAILSGFLSHIGERKEKNMYYARGGQEVMVYPGSAQFNTGHPWIVAAELVETSRLFARTVALIDPAWIEPLACHLVSRTYHDARWDRKAEQVVANEKVSLWGFVIVPQRRVHYGRIDRKEAREIFIREGLVPGELDTPFSFLRDNLALAETVRKMENKIRKRNLLVDEIVLEAFYRERLPEVVNVYELKQHLLKHDGKNLLMTMDDVLQQERPEIPPDLYPDFLMFGSEKLHLAYRFQPFSEDDGISVHIPLNLLHQINPDHFEGTVPGWMKEKIEEMLKLLSKEARRKLTPIADRSEEILAALPQTPGSLIQAIKKLLRERYGLKIKEEEWELRQLPAHLAFRFEVIDGGKIIGSGRDVKKLQKDLKCGKPHPAWEAARQKWFSPGLRNWCVGDIPESVEITPYQGGIPHLGYPGLEYREGKINRTLFTSLEEMQNKSEQAIAVLLEFSLAQEFSRLERSLGCLPEELVRAYQKMKWARDLKKESFDCLKSSLLGSVGKRVRTEKGFMEKRNEVRDRILEMQEKWPLLLGEIFSRYQEVQSQLFSGKYMRPQGIVAEIVSEVTLHLGGLFPRPFLGFASLDNLRHYPRYLKAIETRLTRAAIDPQRDRKKWLEVAEHQSRLETARNTFKKTEHQVLWKEYFWLLEEFKVSLFAQELRTPFPISQQKLRQKWEAIEEEILYS